jgi:hypothetical protein
VAVTPADLGLDDPWTLRLLLLAVFVLAFAAVSSL